MAKMAFSDLRIETKDGDIELRHGRDREGQIVLTLEELTQALGETEEEVPIGPWDEAGPQGWKYRPRTQGQFRLSEEASVTIEKDGLLLAKAGRTFRLGTKDVEKLNKRFYLVPFGVWFEAATVRVGRYAHALQRISEQPSEQHTVESLMELIKEGARLLPLIHSRFTTLRSSVELNLFDFPEQDFVV